VLAGLKGLSENLYEQQADRLREMQRAAVELAVAVASHLTYRQIEADEFPVAALVRQVVDQLTPTRAVSVYLNPLDLDLLRRSGAEPLEGGPELQLLADPALSRGDCRGETEDLTVVSQLEENIRGLREDLLRTLPEAEVERRRQRPGAPHLSRFPDRRQTA
jgi:flagellar assembly protein FliH